MRMDFQEDVALPASPSDARSWWVSSGAEHGLCGGGRPMSNVAKALSPAPGGSPPECAWGHWHSLPTGA